jgi:3-hydroxyisobutyrate dehydrogenase
MNQALSPIGFIGLGLLGQAMALRLVQQGFSLVVWNREPERSQALADAGAQLATSPEDVARQCRVICVCVIDGSAVREIVFGPQGIAQAPRRRRTVVDFSTVDPQETRAIADRANAADMAWIDAPVSGGPPAALSGNLTLMCGGKPDDLALVEPVLSALGKRRTHVGGVGSGQEMKVINQALVGSTVVMLAEILSLARRLGLPLERVPACLEGGLADSVALQRIWPVMVGELFDPPAGRAAQLLKDLKNVGAVKGDLQLPLVEAAIEQYRRYVEDRGAGDAETFSIERLYRSERRG